MHREKAFLWGVMGWLLPAMLSCSGPQQDLPNIICIVADDLGWKDVGFMGSGYYETPLDLGSGLSGRGRGRNGVQSGLCGSRQLCP
jgi:hypothetical protein